MSALRFDRHGFAPLPCPPSGAGPLAGLGFVVKDVFDIAGHVTGAGSPDWAATHPPAAATAPAVRTLLVNGAALIGKTQTDELAFSLIGENAHYGTPENPCAPGRVPGGSSSGSAAAVAAGLAEIGLGTDTAGSIRIPAAFCGLFGFRPSHGAICSEGVVPLAPSFDTVGLLARELAPLTRAADILLEPAPEPDPPTTVVLLGDAFERAAAEIRPRLVAAADRLAGAVPHATRGRLGDDDDLTAWAEAFRVLQAREVWQCHGDWIDEVRPALGPGVRDRIERCRTVTDAEVAAARSRRDELCRRLDTWLPAGTVLCLPTSPVVPPRLASPAADLEAVRREILQLTCVASLAGLPQLSLPVGTDRGSPAALSLIGSRGSDRALLRFAARACALDDWRLT